MEVLLESEEQMGRNKEKGRGKRQRPNGPPAPTPAAIADQTGRLLTEREAEWLDRLESVPKALCCGASPWSLVPKPIPVLRPGQPTEHQLNHADPDLRLAGISQVFIILAVNPAPTQPAEGSFHHPPPRQQLKPSLPGKPADDLNHIPPVLRDPSVQGVIVVLGVRPQLPQARERFSRQLAEDLRCRRRIIHGRTGDGHG